MLRSQIKQRVQFFEANSQHLQRVHFSHSTFMPILHGLKTGSDVYLTDLQELRHTSRTNLSNQAAPGGIGNVTNTEDIDDYFYTLY